MRDIHPHWEANEDTPMEIKVKQKPLEEEVKTITESNVVSRRPAAIVGMLVVLGIGFIFFKGVDTLVGQVAPGGPTVIISDVGALPSVLQVEHGQTITFVNDSDMSLRIESNTLCSDTGYCLQTKTLERGQSDVFTITPDMQSGTYEYASSVSGDIRGSIQITTQTVDDFTDLSSVLQDNFLNEIGANQNPPTPPINSNPTTFVASAGIPRNPYTVGSEQLGAFNTPEPTVNTEDIFPAATAAQTTFAQTRGPIRQPETGAQHWLIVALSIGLLWWSTRRHFAVTT